MNMINIKKINMNSFDYYNYSAIKLINKTSKPELSTSGDTCLCFQNKLYFYKIHVDKFDSTQKPMMINVGWINKRGVVRKMTLALTYK